MNQQTNMQVTKALQANWTQTCHSILDRFTTVTKADLDAALDADDLVHRISATSKFDPSYVESEIRELAGVGAQSSGFQQSQQQQAPYQGQQPQQQNTGQRSRRNRGQRQNRQNWSGNARPFGSYSS